MEIRKAKLSFSQKTVVSDLGAKDRRQRVNLPPHRARFFPAPARSDQPGRAGFSTPVKCEFYLIACFFYAFFYKIGFGRKSGVCCFA